MFEHRIIGDQDMRRRTEHFLTGEQPTAVDPVRASEGLVKGRVPQECALYLLALLSGPDGRSEPSEGYSCSSQVSHEERSQPEVKLVIGEGIQRIE